MGPESGGACDSDGRVQADRVFRGWDYPVFLFLTAAQIAAVVFLLGVGRSDPGPSRVSWSLAVPIVGAVLLYELRWLAVPFMRRPRYCPPRPGWRVAVATTFVPAAEPIEMLEVTVRALVAMDYTHVTYVLDEGDDDDVKELCRTTGARHFTRAGRTEYQQATGRFAAKTKHGNYNAWLNEVGLDSYDIVVNFDPDHIPDRSFLVRELGYFNDPEIGYVQAAQVYYNQRASLVAQGAAEETYAYYSLVQMASFAMGYPIVTGCHTSHRAVALGELGGFAAHEADDLLITLEYRAAGWRGVYVPEVLALGLAPSDWPSYLNQQRRWARSVLDVKLRHYPRLARQLPSTERAVSLLHGLYYLYGLFTALATAMLAGLLAFGVDPVITTQFVAAAVLLGVVFLISDLYRQRFFLNIRTEWGIHWRSALLRFAKWPYMLLALIDALRGTHGPYVITEKSAHRAQRTGDPLAVPHLLAAALLGTGWAVGAARGQIDGTSLHLLGAFGVGASLLMAVLDRLAVTPSFDPAQAATRLEQLRAMRPLRAPTDPDR